MVQPLPSPLAVDPRLSTVAEYLELGETERGYSELVEGRVVMSPNPSADHNHAAAELIAQLRPHLPADVEAIVGVDVDLELAPADQPGVARRPDVTVMHRGARRRQRVGGGIARASDVLLIVEILSPGSRRTDNVAKRSEYADAGIGHYWIVDLSGPVSLLACHLGGDFGSVDAGIVTGRFSTADPFPVEVDLDALL